MAINEGGAIECRVESLAYGGRGVARVDGLAVFIHGGLPGQVVRARVQRVKKRHAEAVAEQVVEPSGTEAEPFCPHFPACGGCAHQHLAYAEQLAWKERQLLDCLRRIGRIEPAEPLPAQPSPLTRGYRNKMSFSFAGGGDRLVLGQASRGSNRIVDIGSCALLPEAASRILEPVRAFCRQKRLDAYSPRTGRGLLRRLIVRADGAGGLLVHLIVFPDRKGLAKLEALADVLEREAPGTSLMLSTRRAKSDLAEAEHTVFNSGTTELWEYVRGMNFRVSAHSFFQTNPSAAEELCRTVVLWTEPGPGQVIYDLYAGAGLFSLALAREAGEVYGFERSKSAAVDAAFNAEANKIGNATFITGPLERTHLMFTDLPAPDTIVLDPPRAGVDPRVLEAVISLRPKRIVYVSCDPATLARDAAQLAQTHTLARTKAVDLFPHTPTIEAAALLILK